LIRDLPSKQTRVGGFLHMRAACLSPLRATAILCVSRARIESMPTLSDIIFYPVKSCGAIRLAEAVLTDSGLAAQGVHDREWMLVDAAGRFLTQREYPRMALIAPRLGPGVLEVSAPGMAPHALSLAEAPGSIPREVHIWDDRVGAIDGGDASADWFSQAIGAPCRLVRFPPSARRATSTRWTGGVAAPTRFADGYPVLLIGAASLDDLNGRLAAAGRERLPMNRFRPNLVIDGLDAFEEDYIAQFDLGGAVLKPVKPCPRCPIPSIDQASGVPGPDPLDILGAYRRKPQLDDAVCFGMNCIVGAGAGTRLTIGLHVEATLAF
jgi:uncharacterized protein YcbX